MVSRYYSKQGATLFPKFLAAATNTPVGMLIMVEFPLHLRFWFRRIVELFLAAPPPVNSRKVVPPPHNHGGIRESFRVLSERKSFEPGQI